ncbi:MAG TPA: RNase H family protein, partial [Alphaproteobacteria bacterium]|nr:RNase H family protein [Alphaproteobacteria bacterium]
MLKLPDGTVEEYSGTEPDTTNNRMELRAVIEALRHIPEGEAATIYSDSRLVVEILSGRWRGKKNPDLIGWARGLARKRHVTFEWVRGHNGNVYN